MPSPTVIEKHTVKLIIADKTIILSLPFSNLGDAETYLSTLQSFFSNGQYNIAIDSVVSSLQPY